MEELFKSSVATLRYNREYELVYLKWEGMLTPQQYREPFLFLLNDFQSQVTGIISDIRKQGVVGPEMRTWLQKEATPKAREKGLKYFYVVSDANVFKQYYVNTIFKILQHSDSVDRRLFQDFEKCEKAILEEISKRKIHC